MLRDLAADQARWPQPPLSYLPNAILEPDRPLRATAVGWLLSFPISMLLAALAGFLLPQADAPKFDVSGLVAIFSLVFFAPVLETLIMGVVLMVLTSFLRPEFAVIVSAVGWGIAHSLLAPAWGLVIWWPFLIFSTLFVVWRRHSLLMAFLVPMAVHALQNLLPALLIAGGVSA